MIGSLLRLSAGATMTGTDLARDRASAQTLPFRYIVLHPADTAPVLRAYITSTLPVRLIGSENGIELYRDRPRDQWPEDMYTAPLDLQALLAEA